MQQGEREASDWLDEHVADHATLVRSEFDLLCAEVSASQQTILAATGHRSAAVADVDWRHGRPDPGPVLVGSPGDACLVASPLGHTIVAVNARRDELYARRDDNPPVVLQLPDGHHVDVATIWCTDDGEVRARFSEFADLRWQIAARPTAPLRAYTKVLHRRRPCLDWTEVPTTDSGFVVFRHESWHVRDGQYIEVTDAESGRCLTLEQLHDGSHSNAVNPHFTPDGSQLVAVYNARDDRTQGGVKASSTRYLEMAPEHGDVDHAADSDAEPPRIPWEHVVHPNGTDGAIHGRTPHHDTLAIEDIGYDPSSTRAAVVDGGSVHLYLLPDWTHARTTLRADRQARAVPIVVPGHGSMQPCWAGNSVVVAADDGTVWRLDLRHDTEPRPVPRATRERAPVAVSSTPERAVLVYADRKVLAVDASGDVETNELPATEEVVAADVTADGRLLVATGSTVELWSGTEIQASATFEGPAVVGVAAAVRAPEWALLWHTDQSITTVRAAGRRMHLNHGTIPHQPDKKGFSPSATGALMVDVDQWYLIQRDADEDQPGRSVVAGPDHWVDVQARCLSHLRGSELIVAGTDEGLDFIAMDSVGRARPGPVELPGPVTSIATGACPRSLAIATPDALWMVRLLL